MERVYVTGASGFLGRYLLKYAPKRCRVLGQYRQHPVRAFQGHVQVVKQDLLTDDWKSLYDFAPRVIIHTAAQASIDACQLHPDDAWKVNYQVTCKLVDVAKKLNARFLFLSSDVIFDGQKGNYQEEDKPVPLNVYAETKVAAEQYILEHHPDALVIRPALFYGQSLNGRPSFTEVIYKNLKAGKSVYLFTDQYRTPVLVNNLATALWELAESDYRGILHIGGSQKVSRYEMGLILCEVFNLPKHLIIPIPSDQANQAAPRPRDCSLNIDRARSVLKTRLLDVRSGLNLAFH